MTVNINASPNHLVRNHEGLTSFRFGRLHSVVLNTVNSHTHVDLHFVGGVRMELDPQTAATLTAQLTVLVAKLQLAAPVNGQTPECSGALADLGDEPC